MSRKVARPIAAATLGITVLAAGSAAAVPVLRHMASGWWNNPDALPALPQNPQVHYEDGASEYARIVARLMPAAIARVEAANGRPFAHPVTVGVYVSRANFAAANGTGFSGAVGVTFLGRVMLSPVLLSAQRNRLVAILTHELCHRAHAFMDVRAHLPRAAQLVQGGARRHGLRRRRRRGGQRGGRARGDPRRRSFRGRHRTMARCSTSSPSGWRTSRSFRTPRSAP